MTRIARLGGAGLALAGLASWAAPWPGSEPSRDGGGESSYVDASIRLDGDLLDWHFVDLEEDGTTEVAVAVRTVRGERELRFHRMQRASIDPQPYLTIPILKDIVAWSVADVRPDLSGNELVFLTRQGAWSYDPRKSGYKGNIAKLCETDLLYDVPSPRELPYWEYVLDAGTDRDGDVLLLPQRGGFRIFGPNPGAVEGELPWHALAHFHGSARRATTDPEDQKRRTREARQETEEREARLAVTVGDYLRPFLGSGATLSVVHDHVALQAPALVDVDHDGNRDMVLLDGDRMFVHLAGPDGIPRQPTRVETLPDYLTHDGNRASLRIVDVDGDGDVDVIGMWSEDVDGFENAQWRVYVMRSTPDALLPAKPDQVLRFEAAELRATVTDVDGDGRPDLAIRRFDLPTVLESVTGLEFTFAHILYLGTKKGTFERRPALRQETKYDEENVQEVLANRELVMDCSGDGVADLVEVDIFGRVGVKRLRKDSSLFGGTTWQIDEGYWKHYPARGSVSSLTVTDLNGDRLGDIVSGSDSTLTVYLSQRR